MISSLMTDEQPIDDSVSDRITPLTRIPSTRIPSGLAFHDGGPSSAPLTSRSRPAWRVWNPGARLPGLVNQMDRIEWKHDAMVRIIRESYCAMAPASGAWLAWLVRKGRFRSRD